MRANFFSYVSQDSPESVIRQMNELAAPSHDLVKSIVRYSIDISTEEFLQLTEALRGVLRHDTVSALKVYNIILYSLPWVDSLYIGTDVSLISYEWLQVRAPNVAAGFDRLYLTYDHVSTSISNITTTITTQLGFPAAASQVMVRYVKNHPRTTCVMLGTGALSWSMIFIMNEVFSFNDRLQISFSSF